MRPRRVRVYWILLLIVAVGLGYRHYRRSQALQKRALREMDRAAVSILAKALQEYAGRHGGDYPDSLDELAGRTFDANVLLVPSLSELSGEPQRLLYRSGCNIAETPVKILVYPPPRLQRKYYPNNAVLVIMTDGTSRYLSHAEFKELLAVQAEIPTSASSPATEPAT